MITITKKFEFEAAHKLEPEKIFGKCSNIHGHTYKLEITITSKNLKNGMIMNFSQFKKIVNEKIINKLDHSFLNDTIGENCTAENIILWIKNNLTDVLNLQKIRLYETSNSYAQWIV